MFEEGEEGRKLEKEELSREEEMGQQISSKGRTVLSFWGLEEENGTANGEKKMVERKKRTNEEDSVAGAWVPCGF